MSIRNASARGVAVSLGAPPRNAKPVVAASGKSPSHSRGDLSGPRGQTHSSRVWGPVLGIGQRRSKMTEFEGE